MTETHKPYIETIKNQKKERKEETDLKHNRNHIEPLYQ